MKRTTILFSLAVGALALLTGCAPVRQTYSQPKPPVPTALPATSTAAAGAVAADTKWRDFFGDEKLRQVVQLALDNNRDLRLAALNVERAQAQFRIQRAQQYPTVNAGASANAYHVPADATNDNKGYTYDNNQVGLQVSSWELDLFGRVKALKAAALEQFLASEQARTAAQITLVGAVAQQYLALASDHDGLKLAEATLAAQKASLELTERRRDAGMATDLDVRQARSQVESALVDISRYKGQITLDENALTLVVGAPVPPALLPGELGTAAGVKDIDAGLSSELLLRRPDIRNAEHTLKAAYANIEAARAAYFPRILLTGGGGFTSGALDELFSLRARTWAFAPQVTLPIFDSGVRDANYRIAQANRDTAVANYEKSIQTAFREVSDALSQRGRLLEQQQGQEALVRTLEETYKLSEARYKAGIDSYLTVLVAERSLYSGRQALVSLRLARVANLVTLYKVLGGGA
jgi:multidrug efflux system outer membrane protein